MALSIRNPEVETLARELAARNGSSMSDEILEALRERKAHLESARRDKQEKIREILAQVDALPILDHRTPDEILGYNEFGGFSGR